MTAGGAAVGYGGKEGGHLGQGVGVFRGGCLEIFVQPVVALPPGVGVLRLQLLPKMLPHQGVGVQVAGAVAAFGGQQPGVPQPCSKRSHSDLAHSLQVAGQTGDGRLGPQRGQGFFFGRAGRTGPAAAAAPPPARRQSAVSKAAISRRGWLPCSSGTPDRGSRRLGDVVAGDVAQVGGQQLQGQGVVAEGAGGVLQLGVRAPHAAHPQQGPARRGGYLLQVLLAGGVR